MKFTQQLLLVIALLTISISTITAQEVNVFGFFQGMASYNSSTTTTYFPSKTTDEKSVSNLVLQQANLFVSSTINDQFSAFVNLEFANNYSSSKGWGTFSLQEIYLKYQYNSLLKAKIGAFLPKFNNLNEIYNRTPLLPYIIRPIIYETSLWGIINVEDFLPQRAFLQVYGTARADKLMFDYSVFVGSPEDSYIAADGYNPANGAYPISGWDAFDYKTVGGRVGLRYSTLDVGVSTTFDKDRQYDLQLSMNPAAPVYQDLGDISRMRLGADLQYNISGVYLSAEVISVTHTLNDLQQQSLDAWSQPQIPGFNNSYKKGSSLDKLFYYVTLGYEFSDYFVYGNYSYLSDKFDATLSGETGTGLRNYMVGGGYKVNSSVVLKLQYTKYNFETDLADFNQTVIGLGLSASF